jgi:hypothetical protein
MMGFGEGCSNRFDNYGVVRSNDVHALLNSSTLRYLEKPLSV